MGKILEFIAQNSQKITNEELDDLLDLDKPLGPVALMSQDYPLTLTDVITPESVILVPISSPTCSIKTDSGIADSLSSNELEIQQSFAFSSPPEWPFFSQEVPLRESSQEIFSQDWNFEMSGSITSKLNETTQQSEIPPPEDSADASLSQSYIVEYPESIINLFQSIRSSFSDYSFIHALSAQMCQEVLPMDCYVTLKLGLLLSIVSIQSGSEQPPIPIITIGRDISSVTKIMNSIGNHARRFITPTDDLKANHVKDQEFIEAGPLLLATHGVCYIGDWLRLKPPCEDFIRKVLDCGKVPAECSSIEFPLECAIWMHWTCCSKTVKKNVKDISMFLNVFGIPIVLEENHSDSIVDFLLEAAIKGSVNLPADELNISYADMKNFLSSVSQIRVTISEEANELMNQYFLATRYLRPDVLSQRGLVILRQMTESHAKLCFRDVVNRIDVVNCISIVEKYIAGIFGVGTSTAPQMGAVADIGEVESFMAEFENWLDKYLERYEIASTWT